MDSRADFRIVHRLPVSRTLPEADNEWEPAKNEDVIGVAAVGSDTGGGVQDGTVELARISATAVALPELRG